MKRASKHTTDKELKWEDYTGGLNYSTNIENIADNDLYQADNVEYGLYDKGLGPVPGLTKRLTSSGIVKFGWYNPLHLYHMIIVDNSIYKTDMVTQTKIGDLTGNKNVSFKIFNHKVYIASGSKLQEWDDSTLKTISNSPNCNMMFVRYGRLCVANEDEDYLFLSGIGDANNWTFDTVESNAKRLEIGYQDDCDISAIVPLSQDVVIFKRHSTQPTGRVFRLEGWFPDWKVLSVGEDVSCINPRCVSVGMNDTYFLGYNGFSGLKTVQEYGSVQQYDAGFKINSMMRSNIVPGNCRMWHIPFKQQIFIQSASDRILWIYHYGIGNGAFTRRLIKNDVVQDIWMKENKVYISVANNIYTMESGSVFDDGIPIKQVIRSKRWTTPNGFVIKNIVGKLFNASKGNGTIDVSGMNVPMSIEESQQMIYVNTNKIYGNTNYIWQSSSSIVKERTNFCVDAVEIKITINIGGAFLNSIDIQYAEVG